MKNVNLNFDLKNLGAKLKANARFWLYSFFVLILILEIFVFYSAGRLVLLSNQAPDNLVPSRGVRLNFTEYQEAVKRIEDGKKFLPKTPIFENPFKAQ